MMKIKQKLLFTALLVFLQLLTVLGGSISTVDLEEAKKNITLATIFQLLENDTHPTIFSTDLQKQIFINHFQIVLDSLLKGTGLEEKKSEGLDSLVGNEGNELIHAADDSSAYREYIIDGQEQVDNVLNEEVEDEYFHFQEEKWEEEVENVIANGNDYQVEVPDNDSVWELVKDQIRNDFAPLWILIPRPIKAYLKQECTRTAAQLKKIWSGGFAPMATVLERIAIKFANSTQEVFLRLKKLADELLNRKIGISDENSQGRKGFSESTLQGDVNNSFGAEEEIIEL